MTDTHLLAQLAEQRTHVLEAVSGLTETAMSRALTPSGWTMTLLLDHLAFDVESFWISAVLGGDPTAIAALHDGWASEPLTGADAIRVYKEEITRSTEVLAQSDVNAPPRWRPASGCRYRSNR
ncbi:mycothiol transferase [Kocuria arenosa]|uniref:mycothiol transferase n=1 Tax=Kocuria arenosa TaxID=3071446 RepID=UPI0034D3E348